MLTWRPSLLVTLFLALLLAPGGVSAVRADSAALGSSRDNTLFEDAQGQRSNGAGKYLFAGRTDESIEQLRRGLIGFDVAGTLPAGSTLYRVMLALHMSRSALAGTEPMELRRVLADWGEGASDSAVLGGGMGAPAATGDATWIHTFFATSTWSSAGGDFLATASASANVGGPGSYVWGSTVEMVADAIRDCSRRGGIVLDAFSGSGTTIMAAEQTGRRGRVVELDPRYVDVAIRRWQNATGGKATLAGSETTFDEIAVVVQDLEA